MRKTKIICTIGTASNSAKTLQNLMLAGMNIARFNMSHNTHQTHAIGIENVKKTRVKLGLPVAIMLDTKGPEVRLGTFENGSIDLNDNDTFTLTTKDIVGNQKGVSVTYLNLTNDIKVGATVLANDGLIKMQVIKKSSDSLVCKVINGGTLSNRKSLNFPDCALNMPYLSNHDKEDLLFGIKHGIDFVAASFVSSKDDIITLRNFLDQNGGNGIDIISKIENRRGLDNIDEIIDCSDGIMIARGDLGVEVPYEELPHIQKNIINLCRKQGKYVITATEMLESMITKPRPTRAEASDVANAVYDGTSAVMLSAETAAGKFPVEAATAMHSIAVYAETNIDYNKRYGLCGTITNSADAISYATFDCTSNLKIKNIIVITTSGYTAKMVSRHLPPARIIAVTNDQKVYYKLSAVFGVVPLLTDRFDDAELMIKNALDLAKKHNLVKPDEKVVVTAGLPINISGTTNMLRIV